jgi:hypothetical protein
MATSSPRNEVSQLEDSEIKNLLLLYRSFENPPFISTRYPKEILEHRRALEEEAEKRGIRVPRERSQYPFSSKDLEWDIMEAQIEEELDSTRQTLSPISPSPNEI